MSVRTTKSSVTFENPFTLGDSDEVFAAGSYEIEIDEERIQGPSFDAYRTIQTLIHIPMGKGRSELTRTRKVDPTDLAAAVNRDQAKGVSDRSR